MRCGFQAAVIVSIGAMILGGCQSNKASEENCKPAVAGAQPDMGMINAACPIMADEDARGTGTSMAYTGENAAWKGKQVAFCCDGCTRTWEKKTPAQRDELLAKVAVK